MRSRPIIQLNITVSNAAAITIGSQPPSKTFTKFEERKTTSIMSRTKNNGIKINLFHFLTVISKKVARIVSTNIAPVTEIPYAWDKFSEFLNPKINNTTPKNKKRFILDKYTSPYSLSDVCLTLSLGI